MPTTSVRKTRQRSRARDRWDAWQAKPVSKRLLPLSARQEGYSVLRVPPALRPTFLDVAHVCLLYDALLQQPKRVVSPDQLACLRAWAEATQALIAALQETPHD